MIDVHSHYAIWQFGPPGKARRYVGVLLDGRRILAATAACKSRAGARDRELHPENAEALERVRRDWEPSRG